MKIKTIAKFISKLVRALIQHPLMAFALSGFFVCLHIVIKMCDTTYTETLGWGKDASIIVGAIAIVLCIAFCVAFAVGAVMSFAAAGETTSATERPLAVGIAKRAGYVPSNRGPSLEASDALSANQTQAVSEILSRASKLDFKDRNAVHQVLDRLSNVITPPSRRSSGYVSEQMASWYETLDELSQEQAQALYEILGGCDELDFADDDCVHEIIGRMWKVITPLELPQFTRAVRILAGLPSQKSAGDDG